MTMRTVSHSLGTGAASRYAHVSGKEELLELVVERVIGEVEFPGEPDPQRWQEQLKDGMRAIRAVFSRHGEPMYAMAIAYEESLYASEAGSPDDMGEFIASMRAYFAGLPPERFPNIVALAGPLTAGEGDERFEFGLEVLFRGLAATTP